MPKPTKGPRLGGSPTHERMILRNLATQLFEHGRITTTETRARRVQPVAEKLITKAKRGDLHSRRLVLKDITDKSAVARLFEEIAPSLEDREGGYTRITKIGPRKGDNAPMAIIEIVTESVEESRAAKEKSGKARRASAPQRKTAPQPAPEVAEAAVEQTAVVEDVATDEPTSGATAVSPEEVVAPEESIAADEVAEVEPEAEPVAADAEVNDTK